MSHNSSVRFVHAAIAVAFTLALHTGAEAQTQCKARVLIMVDTSGSMSWHFSDNLTPDPIPGNTECEPIKIVDGLPPGVELNCDYRIHPPTYGAVVPGGMLGGAVVNFTAPITLWMGGKPGSPFVDFGRTITIPLTCEVHNAPRNPADPVQSFDTLMNVMAGQLPPGDPDFDLLRITAGNAFGMPSPGHTTVRQMPGVGSPAGNYWAVDSFFDITYRIDFVGKPGGRLGGMSGSTTATIRASNAGPSLPLAQMNPLGSANTPAEGIMVVPRPMPGGPSTMQIVDGLPPGSAILIETEIIPLSLMGINPGMLGGPAYILQCQAAWHMSGTGALSDYQRTIVWPHVFECHVGPIDPTAIVQELDNLTNRLQGQLPPGDPDFDLLRITAGNAFGMPSPGHTTLARMPDGRWHVDSFFDITYRIDFVGHAPGPFAGMSGGTTGTIRLVQGGPLPRYTVEEFGLPHTEVGAAQITVVVGTDDMPEVAASNIGSSGNDGVSIAMDGGRKDPLTTFLFGCMGWSGAIDFGPSGNLPSGCQMRAKGTIRGGGGMGGGGGGSFFAAPSLIIHSPGGGVGTLSMDECDPTSDCACGPSCQCKCCNACGGAITVQVSLLLNGNLVASQDIVNPAYPLPLATGPFGTVMSPEGAKPPIISAKIEDIGSGTIDTIVFVTSLGAAMPLQLPGQPPVMADAVVVMSPMAPPMPNIPMPLLHSMEITGANVMSEGEAGVMLLSREAVAPKREYVVQYRESDWDFLTRLMGTEDLDLDGRPDFIVADFDSHGTNGIEFFNPGSEPFIPYWPLPAPSLSLSVMFRVLDTPDGSMPGNGQYTATCTVTDADGDTGSALIEIARCDSGICGPDQITFDFSGLGAIGSQLQILNGGQVIHMQDMPSVYQVWNKIKKDLAIEMERRSGGFFKRVGGAGALELSLKFDEPSEISLTQGGPIIVGDEIRSVGVGGVDVASIQKGRITGANIRSLAILDSDSQPLPLPPRCPADVAPPGGDGAIGVADLLYIIGHWGPCPPGSTCPADIAPQPDGDNAVGVLDLLYVINHWGPCL
jgi:hypothetical protein